MTCVQWNIFGALDQFQFDLPMSNRSHSIKFDEIYDCKTI